MAQLSGRRMRAQLLTSVALCASVGALPAIAQDQSADSNSYSLEEILVTAQKREATLQETPIAVSAVTGRALEQAQIRDTRDMQFLVPSLQVAKRASASNTTFSIRGISSSSFNFGLEPAVGVFVDGVYRSRNGASVNDFLGLERVEVLRGPQSTLFGKNTTAGVINFITKAPHYDTEVEGELTYGNYDTKIAKSSINLPIQEDKLAVRFDVNFHNRDGVIENVDGRELNERDRYGLRGQLLFEANENTRFRIIADYSDIDEECCAAPFFDITPQTQAVLTGLGSSVSGANPSDRTTAVEKDGIRAQLTTKGISGQVDVDFDSVTFTSITALRKYDEFNDFDADFTDLPLNRNRITDQDYTTFTQEIRLASSGDNTVDWMAGAYYLDQDLSTNNITVQGPALRPFGDALTGGAITALEAGLGLPAGTFLAAGSGQQKSLFEQTNQTFGFFVNADWHVSDRLKVTAGARYTKDKKSVVSDIEINDPFAALDFVQIFVGQAVAGAVAQAQAAGVPADVIASTVIPQATAGASAVALDPTINPLLGLGPLQFFPPAPNIKDSRSDDALTGNLIVSYDMSEEVNMYASYSRGFKGGGFALDSAAARVGSFKFEPEKANAYELGLKARVLDNRMSLDFALYQSDFIDFQENLFTGSSFVPGNAGKQRVRGLEFDGKFQASPNLLLTAGFNWLFTADYVEFPNGPCPVTNQDACRAEQVNGGTAIVLVGDLAGQRIAEAPKFSGNFTANYAHPIGDSLELHLRGELFYNGSQALALDGDTRQVQDGYALASASIGIGDVDGAWAVQLWGRNLFDKFYVVDTFNSTIPGGSLNAYVGDPRTYGLTVRFKF